MTRKVELLTEQDAYEVAFLVSRGWRLVQGSWKKRGMWRETYPEGEMVKTDEFDRDDAMLTEDE